MPISIYSISPTGVFSCILHSQSHTYICWCCCYSFVHFVRFICPGMLGRERRANGRKSSRMRSAHMLPMCKIQMDVSCFCIDVFGEIFKIWNIMSVVLSSSLSLSLFLSHLHLTFTAQISSFSFIIEPNKLRISSNESRIANVRIPLCIPIYVLGRSNIGIEVGKKTTS